MRGRVVALVTVVVVLVLLSPALRSSPRDGFPLSNYPMFATDVGRTAVVDTAKGVRADGATVPLSPELGTGTSEGIPAASTVTNAVAAGPDRTAGLCQEIARRIGAGRPEIVQVRIATETLDAVDWFDGHQQPSAVEVRATCPVQGR